MAEAKSQYNTRALDWLDEDKLMLLECWSRDGYTYKDIANRIGIQSCTLTSWMKKYPEIEKAVKSGREIVDYKVENALLKAALGYKTKETKVIIETDAKNRDVVRTVREVTEKDVAPNVTACQVWLYNRLPEKWKRNRDKIIELDEEDSTIQVSVVRAGKDESEDVVNSSIQVESKKQNSQKQEDKDYWPDDWEDEE